MHKHLTTIFTSGSFAGMSDDMLLDRYGAHRDRAAFEVLVARHWQLVFGVCRSVLGNRDDAEDAFQATFLILTRKSGSVRRGCLAPFLHGVALRVATRAKINEIRRKAREQRHAEMPRESTYRQEGLTSWEALHEEIDRLPERYRTPVVLCYLEGQTCEVAASSLGWRVGTVKSRLARGRERLKSRLTLRNAAPSLALLAVSLASETASASAAESLVASTAGVAGAFATGSGAVGSAAPPSVALAAEVLQAMALTKLKLLSAGTIAASAVLFGGVTLVPSLVARQDDAVPGRPGPPPAAIAVEEKSKEEDAFRKYSDRALEEIGYKFHVEGNYPEALRYFDEWSRRAPTLPKPQSMMGWSWLLSKKRDEAMSSFDRATKLDPHDPEGWHGLWTATFWSGEPERSLGIIDKAISLNADAVTFRLDRAMTRIALGNFDGAIRDCDEALRLIPNDPDRARADRDAATAREQRSKAEKSLAEKERKKRLSP